MLRVNLIHEVLLQKMFWSSLFPLLGKNSEVGFFYIVTFRMIMVGMHDNDKIHNGQLFSMIL